MDTRAHGVGTCAGEQRHNLFALRLTARPRFTGTHPQFRDQTLSITPNLLHNFCVTPTSQRQLIEPNGTDWRGRVHRVSPHVAPVGRYQTGQR